MHTTHHHPTTSPRMAGTHTMDAKRLLLGFTVLIERVAHACRDLLTVPRLAHPAPARMRAR